MDFEYNIILNGYAIGILTLILRMKMKVLIYFLLILPHLLPFCDLLLH